MKVYLQKAIASSGECSRRGAEDLIRQGKVRVNGKLGELGQKVDLSQDRIEINGRMVRGEEKVSYLLNKPKGYVCTLADRHATKMAVDLLPKKPRVFPVGRLDKDSRGLLILTNDGELANQMTHPSFAHEKEYEVEVDRKIDEDFLKRMTKGVRLKEGLAKADRIGRINDTRFSIVLHQGWKRQIRRMTEKCGYEAIDLKRVRMGDIRLGRLKEGEYKEIKL